MTFNIYGLVQDMPVHSLQFNKPNATRGLPSSVLSFFRLAMMNTCLTFNALYM